MVRSTGPDALVPSGGNPFLAEFLALELQQLNAARVQGVPVPGVPLDQALRVLETEARSILPQGFTIDDAGESRQLRTEGGRFLGVLLLSAVLIDLVLAAQFESFRDPFIILAGSVPLAISGALLGAVLRGTRGACVVAEAAAPTGRDRSRRGGRGGRRARGLGGADNGGSGGICLGAAGRIGLELAVGAVVRRSFGFDVLACPNCGGRFRLVALIEYREAVQRILRHLGLPAEVPPPRPARAPPQPSAWDFAS